MTIIILSVLAFLAVFAVTVIVLTVHNARTADKLSKLNSQKQALTMLAHAQEYLSKEGSGRNMEWTNARAIIESAMYNVLYN